MQSQQSLTQLQSTLEPASSRQQRPQTAKPAKSKKATGKKKNDPVSRFKNIQNEWSKSKFLQKGGQTGRKLELDRFNKWRVLVDEDINKQ
jgi:hypothetical protein